MLTSSFTEALLLDVYWCPVTFLCDLHKPELECRTLNEKNPKSFLYICSCTVCLNNNRVLHNSIVFQSHIQYTTKQEATRSRICCQKKNYFLEIRIMFVLFMLLWIACYNVIKIIVVGMLVRIRAPKSYNSNIFLIKWSFFADSIKILHRIKSQEDVQTLRN